MLCAKSEFALVSLPPGFCDLDLRNVPFHRAQEPSVVTGGELLREEMLPPNSESRPLAVVAAVTGVALFSAQWPSWRALGTDEFCPQETRALARGIVLSQALGGRRGCYQQESWSLMLWELKRKSKLDQR